MAMVPAVRAQTPADLSKAPQMGWNSWNKFGCEINEQLIKETADAMASSGLKDAGYEYLNIDDCWQGQRDASGNIQPDPKRFPSGMKALADYVHARGLKLGIYSDAGNKTCGGYPGSRGHEYQDALVYADWGIDYIKYDWCDTKGMNAESAYTTMRDAIDATGRPMLFSICEWGNNKPWEWAPAIGHSWRTTGDIYPCWDCDVGHGSWSSFGVVRILDKQQDLRQYAGPGHWNDMDMLEVGNGMTESEDRAHFSLWAMMASPLITGNDLRNMPASTLKILTNKDVIALDQDPAGIEALRMMGGTPVEIYVKPLANNEWAILFLNRSDHPVHYVFDWLAHPLEDNLNRLRADFSKAVYDWTDLWTHATGSTAKQFKQVIPSHDVVVLRLKPGI
ncbi:MAG: glycoside hydrolase family 27 protein [Steroidobacter sp.]